jgi:hypothetical protein
VHPFRENGAKVEAREGSTVDRDCRTVNRDADSQKDRQLLRMTCERNSKVGKLRVIGNPSRGRRSVC